MNISTPRRPICGPTSRAPFPDNVDQRHGQRPDRVTFTLNKLVQPELDTPTTSSRRSRRCRWPGTSRRPAAPRDRVVASARAYGTTDTALREGVHLPGHAAGYNPTNPRAANNSLVDLRHQPALAGRRRPVAPDAFDATGDVTMVPNPTYSGPVKPTLAEFTSCPTRRPAEFNALVGGNLSVGYMPIATTPSPTSNPLRRGRTTPGLSNYYLNAVLHLGHQLLPGQLQLDRRRRQRRQDLLPAVLPPGHADPGRPAAHHQEDLQGLRRADLRAGPPSCPPTYSSLAAKTNPYPYSPSKAKALLERPRLEGRPERNRHLQKAGPAADSAVPASRPARR